MSTVMTDEQTIKNIAENVARLLEEKGMSQAELARATKESEMNISRLVRGTNMPGAAMLSRVADALGVSVDYLISRHGGGPGKKSH